MRQIASVAVLLALVVPAGLSAQARQSQQAPREQAQTAPPEPEPVDDPGPPPYSQSADFTRNRLQQLLYQLPPNVRSILQYDPSLAERPEYLTPYPTLQAFLKQHPEIARNPTYFFGE